MRAQREWINATMGLPFLQAPPKIDFKTGGTLIALLGVFGEELHGDSRQRLGASNAINTPYRLSRTFTALQLPGVCCSKLQPTRTTLVQGDPQTRKKPVT